MTRGLFILFFSAVPFFSYGSDPDSLVALYQSKNDVENFIYACLDQYLADPTEDRLKIFQEYEHTVWRPLASPDEFLAYVILLCNKGFYLSRFGDIENAVEAYEKAWQVFRDHHLANFDIIEYCLKPLGNNYTMLGDHTSAQNIIRSYLLLAEKENNYEQIAGAIINLSIIYHDEGHYQDAVDMLGRALTIPGIPPEKKGLLDSNLAKNFEAQGKFVEAKRFAERSVQFYKTHGAVDAPVHLASAYRVLSLLSLHAKDTSRAISYLEKARTLAFANAALLKARELAKIDIAYAGLLKINRQYKESMAAYNHALATLLPEAQQRDTETLPDPSLFYAENAITESLDGMGDVYERMGQLQKAVDCYELSFVVEDILRSTYNYQRAKLLQQIENRHRADHVLKLLYRLSIQQHDNHYVIRAFQVAERTKALLLRDITAERYGKREIRDTLLRQENQLRFRQASVANELTLAYLKPSPNQAYITELVERQTRLTLEMKALYSTIKKKYPDLSNSRNPGWIDVPLVQHKLNADDATLLEYFWGKDIVYQFVLTGDSVSVTTLENLSEIQDLIFSLSDLLSRPDAANNNLTGFTEISFSLYTALQLKKAMRTKKIVFVPDGLLHSVPLDILLTEKTRSFQYANFPYLIKNHTIAYQASALLYANFREPSTHLKSQKLLGMFPVFENSSQALTYSVNEAESIKQYFEKGTYLMKQTATRNSFFQNASAYSIIHLSTHALPGTDDEPPAIFFYDSILYLPQIYGLHLQADLMVLSACETGIGKLASGEGALSLAHGFQSAGARNIILSLWKVNDRSTATLLSDFYKHYLKTGDKSFALREAKLDYLLNEGIPNAHQSPYYWASFIYYGDFEAMPVDSFSVTSLVAWCVGFLVLLLGYVLWRKKK